MWERGRKASEGCLRTCTCRFRAVSLALPDSLGQRDTLAQPRPSSPNCPAGKSLKATAGPPRCAASSPKTAQRTKYRACSRYCGRAAKSTARGGGCCCGLSTARTCTPRPTCASATTAAPPASPCGTCSTARCGSAPAVGATPSSTRSASPSAPRLRPPRQAISLCGSPRASDRAALSESRRTASGDGSAVWSPFFASPGRGSPARG